MMLRFLALTIFIVISAAEIREDFPWCNGREVISEPVKEYCEANNGTLKHRCCFQDDTESFIAIDLMDLNLTNIVDLTGLANLIPNVVDFRLNKAIIPSEKDFLGVTNLGTLYLPPYYPCPGGDLFWDVMNTTVDPPGNVCSGLKPSCPNITEICVEAHSYCSVNGPNHTACLCEGDYHGYKCLRKGKFPAGAFFGATVSVTVVACALLYWKTRRHVQKRRD